MALNLTDKEKIINYIMNTPYNTNWAVLSSMLSEGDWSRLKQYIEITPKNMNKKVLESLLTITEPIDENYRTVLYTDGTLIINESDKDEAHNIELHGQPTNVYAPFDPNGATDADKYIFTSGSQRPWNSQASSVKSVEIGSNILPTSIQHWFNGFTTCTSIDLSLLNTSNVTNMGGTFSNCRALTNLDVSSFNTSAVTTMSAMFFNCQALTTIYASVNFDVTQVTSSNNMFGNMTTKLVGGTGTTWSLSNPTNKTYARIDGGVSDPGYFTAK